MSTPLCLDALPMEILHHILDNLDTETILFSFRFVCKRFETIVKSYNSFKFNFDSISKTKFLLICNIVPFEQVVSLTLSDKDKTHGQIKLFISLFDIGRFIRLRSLTLTQIAVEDLEVFLQYTIHSSLTYLAIDLQTLNLRNNAIFRLLSYSIEHFTLQQLYLNMWPKDMIELQWPMNCTLSYLRIKNSITINQFYLILQNSPCLKSVFLKDFNTTDTHEHILTHVNNTKFLQLKSLICEDGRIQMDKLEQCLSRTPALIYLRLIGSGNLTNSAFDGARWEQLITTTLPALEKFEFFISVLTHSNFDMSVVEKIIASFRTSFWIDAQHCFTICDYIVHSHKLTLYSLPVCNHHFVYYSRMQKVSVSNVVIKTYDPSMMDNVKKLDLHLSKVMQVNEETQNNRLLFRNITELTLGIEGEWPKGSLNFLSRIIDLLHVVKLSLSVNFSHEYMPSIVQSINELLRYARNINILSLFDYWAPDNCTTSIETVCSMITTNIKHLHIRVRDIDDVKFIIENLTHLTSVTFEYAQYLIISHEKFISYVSGLKRRVSLWECQFALHMWLDNN